MKTILVIYSNTKNISNYLLNNKKRYAFNTDMNVKVGSIIISKDYDTNMIVVEILDKLYTYYNPTTAIKKLSVEYQAGSYKIKQLIATGNGS